ncbi:SRPBCC family protein [Kitasatospora cineracea]|uniref:Polyketide cyclase/dehydrase/lipid transport protein n=1 Tax=Kitasatospora cineracea TaxID=88074 RepID=A0A8G1XCU6_9ACTN|nr:SRPBCC family protein [Kitasatospora cineracea]ROR43551.1 polyketide cyclase/dehydrase/lipid transport protein [Kitasatospora cineracea]
MWQHEYTAETAAAPSAVWAVLSDLDHWTDWDTSMEAVALEGPFEVGGRVSMTPTGQEPIVSVITRIEADRAYADRTEFGGAVLDFSHTLTALPAGGTRVVHRLEITGPEADRLGPELGPMITEDFPDAMAALLARAERTA